jgi:hypothetical protein
MDPKPRPNRKRYIEILRTMTPEDRLRKAFELTEFSRQLFAEGLRQRFPDLPEAPTPNPQLFYSPTPCIFPLFFSIFSR